MQIIGSATGSKPAPPVGIFRSDQTSPPRGGFFLPAKYAIKGGRQCCRALWEINYGINCS